MKIRKIASFYSDASNEEGVTWIREYRGHSAQSLSRHVDLVPSVLPINEFKAPMVLIEEAEILGGRYPLSRSGTLWADGSTYYRRAIELPGELGPHPINSATVDSLVSACHSDVSARIEQGILIGGRENFGHFLFEFLPKFFLSSSNDWSSYTFLVHDSVPQRFLDFVNLIGLENIKIERISERNRVSVGSLLVPAVACHRHPNSGTLCLDRDLYTSLVASIQARVSERIKERTFGIRRIPLGWISRRSERWRRVINEDEFLRLLAEHREAVEIEPHKLDPVEQVAQYGRLDCIISPLGGGSPMSMFCRPGARVVELTTRKINGAWGHSVWCALFGIEMVRVEGYYSEDCSNLGALPIDRDFKIDPMKVLRAVEGTRSVR